jgi:hypothetical protein
MTPAELLARHTKALFPTEAEFTYFRSNALGLSAVHDTGDLCAAFGFPAVVETWEQDARGAKLRATVGYWVPTSLSSSETAAGRSSLADPQPALN